MIDFLFPKLHKEGYRFVAIAIVVTFILLMISTFLGFVGFILTIWIYYFFRDPEKFPLNDESYLIFELLSLNLQFQPYLPYDLWEYI